MPSRNPKSLPFISVSTSWGNESKAEEKTSYLLIDLTIENEYAKSPFSCSVTNLNFLQLRFLARFPYSVLPCRKVAQLRWWLDTKNTRSSTPSKRTFLSSFPSLLSLLARFSFHRFDTDQCSVPTNSLDEGTRIRHGRISPGRFSFHKIAAQD